MEIVKEGKLLLQQHEALFKELIKIPEKREISYREDIEQGNCIGKPRFVKRKFEWSPELLSLLHDHLQKIWIFFTKYSYWFDPPFKEMLAYESRNMSKKSIKFLLEQDVWNTDEVYGAYLIESTEKETIISYFRFDSKVKSFQFSSLSYEERRNWICSDAIHQIQEQLRILWNQLETEIEVCMQEEYHKFPPITYESSYFLAQHSLAVELCEKKPEASLLLLGRLAEIWLLRILGLTQTGVHFLTLEAESKGLLRRVDASFFDQIRYHYNHLKHYLSYDIRSCPLNDYLEKFRFFLNR